MNNLHAGDTVAVVFQDDIYYQRSIGRFMQPFIMVARGVIASPWLITCISVVLMAGALFLISEMLGIENKILLFFLSGVLTCNITVTSSLVGYMPWMDVYAIALILAVCGAWMFLKDKWWGYLAGIVMLICSMGFYQAYIDVALALIVIILLGMLLNGEHIKPYFVRAGKIVASLLLSGVGYWCVYKTVLKLHHVTEAANYNGLSDVGQYEGVSFAGLIADTYKKTFCYLLDQKSFVSTILLNIRISDVWNLLIKICFVACLILLVFYLVRLNIENKTSILYKALQVVLLALFPLACNFVNIISKGMEHDLMVFAVSFFYVLLVYVAKMYHGTAQKMEKKLIPVLIPIGLIIWNNIVFSNQVYFKVDMQDRAALSYATRVIADIEEAEGYKEGVTPVVFIGIPEGGDVLAVDYLKELDCYGMGDRTPFFYGGLFENYLRNYLAVPIAIGDCDIPKEVLNDMDIYPGRNSIAYYEGCLVVKLSN